MVYTVVSCSLKEAKTNSGLPTEFTLQLGPQSSAQVEAIARILEDLGAKVVRDDGGLVAVRPA